MFLFFYRDDKAKDDNKRWSQDNLAICLSCVSYVLCQFYLVSIISC